MNEPHQGSSAETLDAIDARRYRQLRDGQEATKRRPQGLSVVDWDGASEGRILRGYDLDAYLDRRWKP
jgi:hypothetical protein